MPDGADSYTIATHETIAEIGQADWDACAGGDNPFLSHAFLHALEASGSATAETGWLPQHLTLHGPDGRLCGVMPLYVKGHSYGEYNFDHSWAAAYERAGGRYYPKLLSAVPFTPVSGPRFLAAPGQDHAATVTGLASGLMQVARKYGLSGVHINFMPEADAPLLEERGFLIRHGHQYHWQNDDYKNFDNFLTALSSRKRKAIRKERRKVAEAGIDIRPLSGPDLKPHHWDDFYDFYIDTYDRKWGSPYLTRDFFERLHDTLADKVVLVMAYKDDRPIAGALNLRGRSALYGRNWGCVEDYKFLHFEACYYQAIDYAIAHGLQRVEAGTQGEHKIQRGYLPVRTYSAHWFQDEGFSDAVDRFLVEERREVARICDYLASQSPFRQDGG